MVIPVTVSIIRTVYETTVRINSEVLLEQVLTFSVWQINLTSPGLPPANLIDAGKATEADLTVVDLGFAGNPRIVPGVRLVSPTAGPGS